MIIFLLIVPLEVQLVIVMRDDLQLISFKNDINS